MISQQGCVGFMAHNANATMAPFGGAETALGTNPSLFGFPGKTYPVVIDMATSATAKGKLYELARKSDTILKGWRSTQTAKPTTSRTGSHQRYLAAARRSQRIFTGRSGRNADWCSIRWIDFQRN
jgi:LDH2 family malate/lactate/ureidoglycolate dehydrogenase